MTRIHGSITEVWDLEGYGYVETADGDSVFFDRAGVARGHFARLVVGAEVSFERLDTEQGPRAKRLRVVRTARASFPGRLSG